MGGCCCSEVVVGLCLKDIFLEYGSWKIFKFGGFDGKLVKIKLRFWRRRSIDG